MRTENQNFNKLLVICKFKSKTVNEIGIRMLRQRSITTKKTKRVLKISAPFIETFFFKVL